MKKTLVSIATASLIMSSSAIAADNKGIDIVTTGQAVIYYESKSDNGDAKYSAAQAAATTGATTGDIRPAANGLLDQGTAAANYAIQLNLDADLKNGFTFGTQLSYLGTAGLEKNVVSSTRQSTTTVGAMSNISDEIALTKIFIAKKIANTTVKLGRQELPKSLSPFAFSEGWNVLKNTFEAALLVNSDIPDTLVVAAYVSQSNGSKGTNFATFGNLKPGFQASTTLTTAYPKIGNVAVDGTAYMLTIQNKSIPMVAITASYYSVANVNADTNTSAATLDRAVHTGGATALWLDVAVADKSLPMGLKVGFQAGKLSSDLAEIADTTAFGLKVGISPIKNLKLCGAFTTVDGDDTKSNIAITNFGTGVKTPLFTQMIYNQTAISLDADTFMLKAAYNTGAYGTVILQGTSTSAGKSNLENRNSKDTDYTDLELVYKVKVASVNLMAAYIKRDWSEKNTYNADSENALRVIARYNF